MARKKPQSVVTIRLVIEGNPDEAVGVVDKILDAGTLQEEINNHQFDAADLRVVSAVVE